jgi:hypothetical protein
MVGGIIFSPKGTTAAEGAKIDGLSKEDYSIVRETLRVFEKELSIEQLNDLCIDNPIVTLLNKSKEDIQKFDMREFIKIVPDIVSQ